MREILGSGSREIAVVVVPESVEGRDAVVAQVEEAGAMAVTEAQLEAMQQQVAAMALEPVVEYEVRNKPRMPRALLPAMMAAVVMGGGAAPDPFADRAAERRKKIDAENHWRISETDFNAQAKAAAEAKRERRRAKALRCQGGR